MAPTQAEITDGFASSSQLCVDASVGDPGPAGNAEAGSNHLIVGTGTGDTLIGGKGNDILVAGSGNETLQAGTGSDTLIAGGGSDALFGGSGADVFDMALNVSSGNATETINDTTGSGSIEINGSPLVPGLGLLVST